MSGESRPREGAEAAVPAAPESPAPAEVPEVAPAVDVQPVGSRVGAESPAPAVPRFHVHHSYMWLGTLQTGLALIPVLLIAVAPQVIDVLNTSGIPDAPLVVLASILGCIGLCVLALIGTALYQWLSYRHLYYELDADEFRLFSGIFNKKRVHVPYGRVQSVDQNASLLQRVFGVCTVSIDTAGGSANKAVRVPYVRKDQAEALRRELFARKRWALAGGAGAAGAAAGAVPGAPDAAGGDVVAGSGAAASSGPASGAFPTPGQSPVPFSIPSAPRPDANVLDAPAEVWDEVRGVFGGAEVDTGRVTYECGLSNRELVLTGLSSNTAFIVVLLGMIAAVGQFAGGLLVPLVMDAAEASTRVFGAGAILIGVAVTLVIALGLWAASAVGTCISYGGFHVRRRDSRIEVERGLLQHRFESVDVDRVQSVIVRQGIIRRLLGYCEVAVGRIDATASGSSDRQQGMSLSEGLVVHPFVKLDRVSEVLAGILPEYGDVPVDSTPVAPVALRRALVRRCVLFGTGFWIAVLVTIGVAALNLSPLPSLYPAEVAWANMAAIAGYVIAAIALALNAAGAVLWHRESGFACNERFMQVSNGGLSRETVSFPRRKIQYGCVRENPLQRRAHVATIVARTASGVAGTSTKLVDVRVEDARAWLVWLEPRPR